MTPGDTGSSVAVVGMGIVVPQASTPEEFWQLLHGDQNIFDEPEHFSLDNWFSTDVKAEDKSYVRAAGFIGDFTPHPRLAAEEREHGTRGGRTTRLLRHCLLQALDHVVRAGDDRTACYVGTPPSSLELEEATLLAAVTDAERGAPRPGALRERLEPRYRHAPADPRSVFPDVVIRAACEGILSSAAECQAVDTACSSALYAIDLGVKSLLSGERDLVLCGGTNTGPRRDLVLFSKAQGFSRSGQVRAYDAEADGSLFSDAAAIVALKRLDRALADGDEILGLLGGFGASVDGVGSIVAPDLEGQKRAVRRARAVNATRPETVDWIVGHGTATRAGDTTELEGLAELAGDSPQLITSNKCLVGHGAWAAGAISVVHALLALRHQSIPGERYFKELREGVRAGRLTVPVHDTPWPRRDGRVRTAGVCAYGLGGSNAHLLVHGAEAREGPVPRALPADAALDDTSTARDPVVLVGWHAQLPGHTGREDTIAWLRGEGAGPQPTFGASYPLPPFKQLRMPPVTARSIDRTHLMAIAATSKFVEEYGELWAPYGETTGVFTGHMGPTRAMSEYTVRVAADDLIAASAEDTEGGHQGPERLSAYVDALRERLPAANDASMPGQLPNVIACQVANRHRLGGMAVALDAGRASTQAALHTASRYLASGELDLALVFGVNGDSGPIARELTGAGEEPINEGAVLLVLTRRSLADKHGWDVLAHIRSVSRDERTDKRIPELEPSKEAYDFLGAEGAVAVLRALYAEEPTLALGNRDTGPRIVVARSPSTSRQSESGAVENRAVVAMRRLDAEPADPAAPAIRPFSLILTDSAATAQDMADQAGSCGSYILSTDPGTLPGDYVSFVPPGREHRAVEGALARIPNTPLDLLVIGSARLPDNSWPAPPPPRLLSLQECLLIAVQRMTPPPDGSVAALLLDPLRGHTTHPHLTLVTGLLRSLALELPCPVHAVVTDAAPEPALAQLAAERTAHRDRTVVQYRQGVRYVEQVCPAPLPSSRRDASPSLDGNSVVVATGGARGATAACLTALARRARPRVWLLGTTPVDEVPADLLDTRDDQLGKARNTYLAGELKTHPGTSVASANRRFDALLRGREIHSTLRTLRELCGEDQVHYVVCDVRDAAQVERAARQVYDHEGRVDLLVHGAGVIRSAPVEEKSEADFRAVRDVKVLGYHHLKRAFADPAPRLWCNFGSISGLTGCAGDTDYSPANEYLAAAARAEHLDRGAEFTVNWGLWAQTGMVKHLADHLARTLGVTGMSSADGAAAFLSELNTPHPPEPVPLYGLGDSRHGTGSEGWTAAPLPPGGLLGEAGAGPGHWSWTPDARRDSYLGEHLVDGRPLLPAVMMLELAAEAALRLRPGTSVQGFRNFTIEAPLYVEPSDATAGCRVVCAAGTDDGRVQVELRSDLTTPDGVVLARDRRHCSVDVVLGTRQPAPHQQPPPPRPALPECPSVRPDTSVQLSGVWRTLTRPGADPAGADALWTPRLEPDGIFARLAIPALLLDSLSRLFGYPPQPSGAQGMGVPLSVAGIDLFTRETDVGLAQAHPEGLRLWYTTATKQAVAATPEGQVLVSISDLVFAVIDEVAPHEVDHRAWTP
ncbi:SDR family NAD(P)-dependent oxidoreductase [Streptomyces sp. NPDC058653]|uniref:SDR family NAD(P)-dependent oxidoreductase n=1 Tax=Streptomyces sp. NPDC058653 TaxID=3346576 RepID=UPI003653AFFD